ncbi:GrBNV gp09-like protein-like protein [Mauternbach virus]|uniref:GrBNV gp09-like protein-like protein n=1 Tax=Mauternbach virus TaxID=2486603 RepID=A0A3G3E659_9VIRU|nr:GrBNV gp09-like protein-like protein [Mauternbach virus]AYP97937.1 GrBNV gp09-like protein-like protein [Mauternbach virus]
MSSEMESQTLTSSLPSEHLNQVSSKSKSIKKKLSKIRNGTIASRSKKNTLAEKFIPTVTNCGKDYKINCTRFYSQTSMFLIAMKDFNIITNAPLAKHELEMIPHEMKPLLQSRWYFAMHVSYGMGVSINRSILRARVTGGEIISYKYAECSIEGNECVYYGFLPTISSRPSTDSNLNGLTRPSQIKNKSRHAKSSFTINHIKNNDHVTNHVGSFEGTHRVCRISTKSIWPRKLYVQLSREHLCNCSENCWYWSVRLNDYHTLQKFCFKKIPWSELYIIMGENDTQYLEQLKSVRACVICAQCFDCANSPIFCRRHRQCKHKKAIFFENSNDNATLISDSKIKSCVKF